MAIAHVNIAEVESFSRNIEQQREIAADVQSQMTSTVSRLVDDISVETDKASIVQQKINESQKILSEKQTQASVKLNELYSTLASTPETITESVACGTDEDGNTIYENIEVPNPEFGRLQSEIGEINSKISYLDSLSSHLISLATRIEQQQEVLNTALSSITEAGDEISNNSRIFLDISESANDKLHQILSIIQEYKETKISPPTVSSKRSLRGLIGGLFGRSNSVPNYSSNQQFNQEINSRDKIDYPRRTWEDEFGAHEYFYGAQGRHHAESVNMLIRHQGQARSDYQGTCGLASSANVLRQLTGAKATEEELINRALELGACREPDGVRTGGGTSNSDILQIMKSYDLNPAPVYDLTLSEVADCLDHGGSLMMSVIARYIGENSTIPDIVRGGKRDTDHWVTVTGVRRNQFSGDISGVYIQDTGGHAMDSHIYLSAEQFNRMRQISNDFTGIAVFK